jgi:hypothetical protein
MCHGLLANTYIDYIEDQYCKNGASMTQKLKGKKTIYFSQLILIDSTDLKTESRSILCQIKAYEGNDVYITKLKPISSLLIDSNLYDAKMCLERIKSSDCKVEKTFLYYKLGEYELLISLLIDSFEDFIGAAEYCLLIKNREERHAYLLSVMKKALGNSIEE